MRRALGLMIMIALPFIAVVSRSEAALYLGWADEFLLGFVHCKLSNNECVVRNHMAGSNWLEQIGDASAQPTWAYLGQQGGNAAGRANVKSKVMVTFRDDSSSLGGSITVTISRQRTGVPPAEGTGCSGITFVGSSSTTFESTTIPAADWKYNNRMLPTMDFSLETWSGGTTIGYNDTLILNNMSGQSVGRSGCFKILWN